MTLPIHAALPELLAVLREGSNAVLVAPPGAGKTTAVAPGLLDQPWCAGEVLLLSPRRIAARAAAERMAELRGEGVGETVGYATRMDSRRSAKTRILVLTEGIFRNRIQADPELTGVSVVLFDEVHERSLDCDAGLAFALDAQAGLRPDLRLVAMSATLDGARFATLMRAPVIESEGRAWPLEIRYAGRTSDRIEDAMAAAIRSVIATEQGSVLAFLPGVAELERTAGRLDRLPSDVVVHTLYGALDPAAQRAAIAPSIARKIVLATSIAESSLTIDGVRIVVDSGLARRPRYDRSAGLTRLVTERASQAAVIQRAGRAARQGPGLAVRLWEEAATGGLPRFDPPEILEADLSALMLDCALWGVTDPCTLRWIDPPPGAAMAEARTRLLALAAIDHDGRPTAHGKAIAAMPLPPRLAHMLIASEDRALAAEVAMLLTERGLGGPDADLDARLSHWRGDRGRRADSARAIARRWTEGSRRSSGGAGPCIALAFPDRVARRRSGDGVDWISIGGRGFRLDPMSSLARAEWLAVAETQGSAAGARILSAAALTHAEVEMLFADTIAANDLIRFDPATGGVTARRERKLGSIILASVPFDAALDVIAHALVEGVRVHGLKVLEPSDTIRAFQARARFARVDGLDEASLIARIPDWLPALVSGLRRLSEINNGALVQAWLGLLDWSAQQALDRRAPREFVSLAGTRHAIDYTASAGPTVEVRLQALFGMTTHPVIGDNVPLVLSLTSPGSKPIQTTCDLPGFWKGSWADVAKEMRGRYPRHNWPDDPTTATASLKTKNALARER
ncbi:ATP-dependent helicase HrpB [Sphingomonas sp.]|uniref:ATP-dependent helicase HrpB n=1 Tax=Sphingomonas sp. TaxID=28214 RepID=UPI0025F5D9BA|nr:ATP-dependent helicase HrpB [Sphingomonas sp.]